MLIKIIPVVVLAGALALTGCSAVDTHLESERLSAQARADEARAALTTSQAISATLAIQAAQAERLTSEVVSQAEASRVMAIAMTFTAAALAILFPAMVIVLTIARLQREREEREERARETLIMQPRTSSIPTDRHELRAMYRAIVNERNELQRERIRLLAAQRGEERER